MKTTNYWPVIVSTSLITALLLGSALTLPINVAAEIQPVDEAPSKTLLLPYFEVDTNKKGTLFDINNKNGVDKTQSQKPNSSAESDDMQGQHKKNKKNKNKHHDDGNTTYDGSPILYHKPKPTSDKKKNASATPAQWKKTADDAQGRFSVDFDATKSPAPAPSAKTDKSSSNDTEDQHKKDKNKQHHHHGDDQNQGND